MTGDITGVAVSIHPDLLHCPPLFQLKTSGLFTKSSELLHLPPRRKIKSSEVFEISYLNVFTRLLKSNKNRFIFSCSDGCMDLKLVG